jgi:hypothetical protein
MDEVTAELIAEAFGVNCPKKNWAARVVKVTRGDKLTELVSFKDRQGLISIVYDTERQRFSVTFEKALASWGDYNNAIAKWLQTVLTALQAGGLPFEAPASLDDIIIRTNPLSGFTVVSWEPLPAAPELEHTDIF